MNQILWRKKSLRTKLSVLLVFVLIGTMLSGCGMPGMLRAEAAETAGTTSGAEIESLGETDEAKDAAKDSGGESKSGAGEDALLLEYNSGGETPTITTVTFFPDKGMVEVNALASSMYELTYKSAYTMDDGKLAIDTVSNLTATDTSGVAKVIGLPETMTASAFHTVTDEDGASMLTIRFGDPEKSEEAAILCEIKLSEETLSILNEAAANVREILFLEYASETEDEDSSQTTADIRFFSNGTCTLSGCLNSLYNWEYTTQWEFDNILIIEDPEVLNLIAVEDAKDFVERMGLEPEYKIAVQNKISLEEDTLMITLDGVPAEGNDLLLHMLTENIHPRENLPDEEKELLEFDPSEEKELPRMAEFALVESDAQSLGFSLDDITVVELEGISFAESELMLAAEESKTLEVIFKPENATNKALKWKSENTGVASVDAKGTVTGKSTGKTKITAVSEDGGFEAVCSVEVLTITPPSKPQASVSGEVLFTVYSGDSSITFYGNGQCAVNATHYEYADAGAWPFYASYTTRYDFSGNQLVISGASTNVIDGIGVLPNMPMRMNHSVSMTGDGGASITITTNQGNGFGTYSLSAAQVTQLKEIAGLVEKPAVIAVEAVSLNETALTLEPGAAAVLTATITPQDAANTAVTWTSSNENVATVTDGQVQAVGEGTADITVTTEDGGKTAVCTVTVATKGEPDPGTETADITLTYDNGGGDLATKTTVEFYLAGNKVRVNALASGMYQLTYETAYSIEGNQLTIATAPGVVATDITGIAGILGLPPTMTADVMHTVTGAGDTMKLTVMFADTGLGEFTLDADMLKKLGIGSQGGEDKPDDELKGDITLSYDDGQGDLATKSTAAFYLSGNIFKMNALASGMYALKYETTYTVTSGQLTIATASGVTAADVTGVAGLIGLPETMTGDVTHTVTVDGDQMKLTVMFADKMIGEFMLDSTAQEQLGISPDSEINPMAFGMAVGANSLKAPENEAEIGIEAETEVETETKAETQAETMIETETGAEAETKTETETEVETETKAETETEVETVTKTETETEVETATKAETETEVETETETETETENVIGENAAETEVETEGETQAETVTRAETVMGESASETVKVTAITFERPELSMEVGSTVRLKTTITPTDADNQKLTWKSSGENIVKIVKDELQAVGEGTVTITVTTEDGGKKAECKITVTKKAVQESPEPQQTTDNSLDDAQVETKQPETDKPEEEKIPEDNQSEVTDTLS